MTEKAQHTTQLSGLQAFVKDARNFQILYLSIFLVYGIQYLDWEKDIPKYMIILSVCLSAQAVGIFFTTKNYAGIKSAMITGLGLCLLLRTDQYWLIILAAVISIASKFLIRVGNKHIFNPANFGIAIALFTNQAYVSPGQWGSDALFVYFVGFLALVLLLKVGRVDTSLVFLGTLFLAYFVWDYLYKGWPFDHMMKNFTSGSLLLFAFFMITDPMTTPNSMKGRIIWSVILAAITFYFKEFQYNTSGDVPILALFFISPITVALDRVYRGTKYSWV